MTVTLVQHDLTCADCGAPMQLVSEYEKPHYRCMAYPSCAGRHGAHPDGTPLGIPANQVTRRLRMDVHAVLNAVWSWEDSLARAACYRWLEHVSIGHVARMDAEECTRILSMLGGRDAMNTMTLADALLVAQYYFGQSGHAEYDPFTEQHQVGMLMTTAQPGPLQKQATRRFLVAGKGQSWEEAFRHAGKADTLANALAHIRGAAGRVNPEGTGH